MSSRTRETFTADTQKKTLLFLAAKISSLLSITVQRRYFSRFHFYAQDKRLLPLFSRIQYNFLTNCNCTATLLFSVFNFTHKQNDHYNYLVENNLISCCNINDLVKDLVSYNCTPTIFHTYFHAQNKHFLQTTKKKQTWTSLLHNTQYYCNLDFIQLLFPPLPSCTRATYNEHVW